MPKKIGKVAAFSIALENAASLIECSDLDKLFGDDQGCEGNEDVFTEAQKKVVTVLRLTARKVKGAKR